MRQITVMHGPERRRRWIDEERLRILAEAAAPGACVADVARRHDISTARIYTWRHKLRQQIAGPQFAEAVVDAGNVDVPISEPSPAVVVELGNKMRMTVFPCASAALVEATLKALR
ncbi:MULTISPECIES: transposase [unclassified Novosphingobium]|uniref:IS66-like element accessory protein TnpA n=1 Tax=unclassified Novosphingobium TaxID=2644732 RepID=UPI00146D5043|nr:MULTISPECIES: transposase [unclassified Novosphingobium]NMN05030.1 transposase [Novosphingobium sp. SG919]NMN87324.1 transposase [Novosphingobium sp. SG916]